ncbi:MAG: hypothetical protein ISP72_04255 [Flavobacteriaceae bacterium]|nr:hypothetical protein [Flavobacteriaceae bacterium]
MKKMLLFLIFILLLSCEKLVINTLQEDGINENEVASVSETASSPLLSETETEVEISRFSDKDPNNDVIMQAFWWSSYNDSRLTQNGSYYNTLNQYLDDISRAHIDLLWLPPLSDSADGMGYHPRELFNFNSLHGTKEELESLLINMGSRKIHAMADLVFNHRAATETWTDFFNPSWSCESICIDDEATTNPNMFGTVPCGDKDEGLNWSSARDLNHKSIEVQEGLKEFISRLNNIGFDSWRYDFGQGYPSKYIASYNNSSSYYIAVAEVWSGNIDTLKYWIDNSDKTISGQVVEKTAVFDFALKYKLNEAIVNKRFDRLNINYSLGFHQGYKDKSITFLDNHDSGCINHNNCESLYSSNIIEIEQGYAYLLTHPGIPMIWIYHYLFADPFGNLKQTINQLIELRKEMKIHANSNINVLDIANGNGGYYLAEIDNKLLIEIGSGGHQPNQNYDLILSSSGFNIWKKTLLKIIRF